MKMNIKGLVFVGFAAAVFASAANADLPAAADQPKTVTSVKFTEATYVKKNADITGATKTKITYDAKGLVTAGADLEASDIPDISDTYQLKSERVNNLDNPNNSTYPTTQAVADALTETGAQVGNGQLSIQVGNNAAQTFTANQATGTNTTVTLGSAAGLGTATTIASTSTDSDAATAKAVYDYVDTLDTDAYTGTGLIDVTDHVITTTAQQNVIETVKVNGTALTPDSNKAVDITVPAAGDGQLSIQVGNNAAQTFTANQATGTNTTVTLGSAAGLGTATTIASTSTDSDAATAKAVYDYVQTYAPTIEAIPSTCTASTPCALVAAGNGAKWEPIQQ